MKRVMENGHWTGRIKKAERGGRWDGGRREKKQEESIFSILRHHHFLNRHVMASRPGWESSGLVWKSGTEV